MTEQGERPPAGRREAVIIVNPAAHNRPSPKRLSEADAWLRGHGWETAWQETAAPGDATSMAAAAAARGADIMFVCGGDGTLNEAVNGLAGSGTTLAPIPGGTSNIWAREVGLDKKPIEAVRLAAEGDRRRIDLGRAGAHYFILMAGYGIDAAVTHRVSLGVKKRLGATAYLIAALREWLTYQGSRVTLRMDGDVIVADVLMLVAGNTRGYAGLTQITSSAVADDGLLDICVYQGRSRFDMAMHAVLTLLRQHRRSKKVLYRRVSRLEMDWDRPLPLQVDGDPKPDPPADVTVARGALLVAVPRGLRTPLLSG
jgi:YegS/Rv2252/BmrU family lipid kinase